jgi:tetratricopeptide (TPR) repeat protein
MVEVIADPIPQSMSLNELETRAEQALWEGDLDQARIAALHALSHFPKSIVPNRVLADILAAQGRATEALAQYALVAAVDPLDHTVYQAMAELAAQLRQTQPAFRLRTLSDDHHSGAADPSDVIPVQISAGRLAILQERSGLLPQAIDGFIGAVAADDSRLDLYLLLARSLFNLRLFDQAEEVVVSILSAAPDCLEANVIAACLCRRSGRIEDYASFLDVAFSCDPSGKRIACLVSAEDTASMLNGRAIAVVPLIDLGPLGGTAAPRAITPLYTQINREAAIRSDAHEPIPSPSPSASRDDEGSPESLAGGLTGTPSDVSESLTDGSEQSGTETPPNEPVASFSGREHGVASEQGSHLAGQEGEDDINFPDFEAWFKENVLDAVEPDVDTAEQAVPTSDDEAEAVAPAAWQETSEQEEPATEGDAAANALEVADEPDIPPGDEAAAYQDDTPIAAETADIWTSSDELPSDALLVESFPQTEDAPPLEVAEHAAEMPVDDEYDPVITVSSLDETASLNEAQDEAVQDKVSEEEEEPRPSVLRRWVMPKFDRQSQEEPVRSKLADLAETVGQQPLNNGTRYDLAIELETADPAQAVAQYAIIVESRDPRLVTDVRRRLEALMETGAKIHGLQRLLGDVCMQQGAFERAIDCYSLAFDELRARQITDKEKKA